MHHRAVVVAAIVVGLVSATMTAFAEDREQDAPQSVHYRDIHRGGLVAVIGHFGLPIGQIVRLEGVRARPLKTTNRRTLRFTRVNGVALEDLGRRSGYPPDIQIENVNELPEGKSIVVEGYERLRWRGDPQKNWLVEVSFVVTKVISSGGLELDTARQ